MACCPLLTRCCGERFTHGAPASGAKTRPAQRRAERRAIEGRNTFPNPIPAHPPVAFTAWVHNLCSLYIMCTKYFLPLAYFIF
jgi:hypothetical protein